MSSSIKPTFIFDLRSTLSFLTCAEQQEHLHAQVLVIGDLQSDELVADLQHLLALVIHERQIHALSEETKGNVIIGEQVETTVEQQQK